MDPCFEMRKCYVALRESPIAYTRRLLGLCQWARLGQPSVRIHPGHGEEFAPRRVAPARPIEISRLIGRLTRIGRYTRHHETSNSAASIESNTSRRRNETALKFGGKKKAAKFSSDRSILLVRSAMAGRSSSSFRLLDLVRPFMPLLPEVREPDGRRVPFRRKLACTAAALFAFLACSQLPLYGLHRAAAPTRSTGSAPSSPPTAAPSWSSASPPSSPPAPSSSSSSAPTSSAPTPPIPTTAPSCE